MENPLLRDRVFVIVNEEGDFVSLKKLPTLTLTQINVEGNRVTLSHPNDHLSSEISFEIPEAASTVKQITCVIFFKSKIFSKLPFKYLNSYIV